MTPEARIAASIEILDEIAVGVAAEKALTTWARRSRFAGSKDRAAIRDHVFDVLRCRQSCALLGGGAADSLDGRTLMIGALRAAGTDPDEMFTGQGHAPPPLSQAEKSVPSGVRPVTDVPDWLLPSLKRGLGDACEDVLALMRSRADLHLRVNSEKSTQKEAIAALAAEGILAQPHPLSPTALVVTEGARKLRNAKAYQAGRVEIQDAASQAVADVVPLRKDDRVLDYCAGGGGKSLALAARVDARYFAHDANPRRLSDLPARAARAGAQIKVLSGDAVSRHAPFDVVVADVPCSGSGAWRRQPEAKWALTPARLADLHAVQDSILKACADLAAPKGTLVYMTCSMLPEENQDRVAAFLSARSQWALALQRAISPAEGADGLFVAIFRRK